MRWQAMAGMLIFSLMDRRADCRYPSPLSYPPPLHQVSKLLVFSDLREACFVKFFVFRTLGSGGLENKGVKNLLKNPLP